MDLIVLRELEISVKDFFLDRHGCDPPRIHCLAFIVGLDEEIFYALESDWLANFKRQKPNVFPVSPIVDINLKTIVCKPDDKSENDHGHTDPRLHKRKDNAERSNNEAR